MGNLEHMPKIVVPGTQNATEAETLAPRSAVCKEVPRTSRGAVFFEESDFQAMLTRERRRAERSRQAFRVDAARRAPGKWLGGEKSCEQALSSGWASTRQTDMIGWYKQSRDRWRDLHGIGQRRDDAIRRDAEAPRFARGSSRTAAVSGGKDRNFLPRFPGELGPEPSGWVADSKLYPDLEPQVSRKRLAPGVKRAIDLLGSAGLLLVMRRFWLRLRWSSRSPQRGRCCLSRSASGSLARASSA